MKIRLLLVLMAVSASAPAFAQSCEDLYVRRNGIYKDAGFCFKTARAIRTFGNSGCQYDDERDVPLSPRQRAMVRDLEAQERDEGCRY